MDAPRSVAADWVLESGSENSTSKPKPEPLGGSSGDSTLDTKPVTESASDPGPSTAIAVAIPTTRSLESEISPQTARPIDQLPHPFDAAPPSATSDETERKEDDAPKPKVQKKLSAIPGAPKKPVLCQVKSGFTLL